MTALIAHLRYLIVARRLARQQQWLDRHLYSSYGEGPNR